MIATASSFDYLYNTLMLLVSEKKLSNAIIFTYNIPTKP